MILYYGTTKPILQLLYMQGKKPLLQMCKISYKLTMYTNTILSIACISIISDTCYNAYDLFLTSKHHCFHHLNNETKICKPMNKTEGPSTIKTKKLYLKH